MLLGFPTTLLNSRIVGGADVQIVGNTDGNGNITNRVFETSLSTRIKAICTFITKKRLIIGRVSYLNLYLWYLCF